MPHTYRDVEDLASHATIQFAGAGRPDLVVKSPQGTWAGTGVVVLDDAECPCLPERLRAKRFRKNTEIFDNTVGDQQNFRDAQSFELKLH